MEKESASVDQQSTVENGDQEGTITTKTVNKGKALCALMSVQFHRIGNNNIFAIR